MENLNLDRRIIGTETEYGIDLSWKPDHTDIDSYLNASLPGYIFNGGQIYNDCSHIEYCTPECLSIADVIKFEKAGDLLCTNFTPILCKNNVCTDRNTFGGHENYFTSVSIHSIQNSLIPFLIARQLFTGAGWVQKDGSYFISQRALFMNYVSSQSTLSGRGIINTRDEKLSDIKGFRRLHLISSDSNMCERAIFLKVGTMSLMLSLLEDNLFPHIDYDINKAVFDMHNICRRTREWKLEGIKEKSKWAVDVLAFYESACRNAYYGRDREKDMILDIWREVNEGLIKIEDEQYALVGSVDWVTKRFILQEFINSDGCSWKDERIRSFDVEYHRVDKEGLFYEAQRLGLIKRVVSDKEIEEACVSPPRNTRAKFRGNVARCFAKENNHDTLEIILGWDWCAVKKKNGPYIWKRSLPDPANTYDKYFAELTELLQNIKTVNKK